MNEILTVDTTKNELNIEIPVTIKDNRIVDRSQARLYATQTDPDTYRLEPEGAPELYEDWLDHFRLGMHFEAF